MRIYHLLTHTMEQFYPYLKDDPHLFSLLDHPVNRFIRYLILSDKSNRFEHTLINLSSSLKQSGKKVYVHKDGYEIVVLPAQSFKYPFEFSRSLVKYLKSIIDNEKNALLHVHGISSYIYEQIGPYLSEYPSIVHYRGGHFTWRAFPMSFPKYCVSLPFLFRFPRRLFIENKLRIEKYHRYYGIPIEKMKYIPNPIDTSQFKKDRYLMSSLRDSLNISPEDVVLLFVGRLEKSKGLLDLIKVYEMLHKTYPSLKLLIVGHGSLRKYVETLSSTRPDILYVGQVSFQEVIQYYFLADIFVLPTYYDSFGMVLAEAMAASLPVVSTTVEGPLSIVDDKKTGFLVKPGDILELYKKLEFLISNPDVRKAFGKNGLKKVRAEFDWKKVSSEVLSEYQIILEG